MSTHVNLMKSGEFRRQGAVSGLFVMQVCIFTTLSFGIIFGALAFMHYQIAQKELVGAREVWKMREPIYNTLQAMRNDLTELQKIGEELNKWSEHRDSWDSRLLELQGLVPPSMQIRRLVLQGITDWARAGSGPLQPGRIFDLLIEGRIEAVEYVQVADAFVTRVRRAEGYMDAQQHRDGLIPEPSSGDIPVVRFRVEAKTERVAF